MRHLLFLLGAALVLLTSCQAEAAPSSVHIDWQRNGHTYSAEDVSSSGSSASSGAAPSFDDTGTAGGVAHVTATQAASIVVAGAGSPVATQTNGLYLYPGQTTDLPLLPGQKVAIIAATSQPPTGAGSLPAQTGTGSANAGALGEFASMTLGDSAISGCTSTNASPTVITCAANTLASRCIVATGSAIKCVFPVYFTGWTGTSGFANSTPYWVDPASISGSTFKIATSAANALAGTDINTTATDTGAGNFGFDLATSATPQIIGEFQLTPGDWDCTGGFNSVGVASTAPTAVVAGLSSTGSITNGDGATVLLSLTFTSGAVAIDEPVGVKRFSLSAATAVSLILKETWTGGATNPTGGGAMRCRRAG